MENAGILKMPENQDQYGNLDEFEPCATTELENKEGGEAIGEPFLDQETKKQTADEEYYGRIWA